MDSRIKSKMELFVVTESSRKIDVLKKLRNGDEESRMCYQKVCNVLEKMVCELTEIIPILRTEDGYLHFLSLVLGHTAFDEEKNVPVERCTEDNVTSAAVMPRENFDVKGSTEILPFNNVVFQSSPEVLIHENIDVQHSQDISPSINLHVIENTGIAESSSSDNVDVECSQEVQRSDFNFKSTSEMLLQGNVEVLGSQEIASSVNINVQCPREVPTSRTFGTSHRHKTDLPGVKLKVMPAKELGKLKIEWRRNSIDEDFAPIQVAQTPTPNSFIEFGSESKLPPEVMLELVKISYDRKEIVDELGQGSFGRVSLLHCPITGLFIADKAIDTNRTRKENIRLEIEIMESMRHPRILRIYGHIFHAGIGHIFMEWMPGGSLKELRQRKPFSNRVIEVYAKQILEGVAYIHTKSIVHRDLKGANIFISSQGTLKIADFGLARNLTNWKQDIGNPEGTYLFCAPEYLRGGESQTAGDIWSFASVIVEMATGMSPWPHMEKQANDCLLYKIGSTEKPPEVPHQLAPSFLRDVVKWCFCLDPDNRPSAIQLLELDVFTSLGSEIGSFQKETDNFTVTDACEMVDSLNV